MNSPDQKEVNELKGLIENFIGDRLIPKLEDVGKQIKKIDPGYDPGKPNTLEAMLDKLKSLLEDIDKKTKEQEADTATDPDKPDTLETIKKEIEKLLNNHKPDKWLADAARRVAQIKMVTHAIKYSHPDARGTSVFAGDPRHIDQKAGFIGSHTINNINNLDVVGNAAALDVFKFLKLEFQGRTILDHVRERDNVLAKALSDDNELSNDLIDSFLRITQGDTEESSHAYARQLFFPLHDCGYHLLSPLFPTSLVHSLYQRLREERFSDHVKKAREARREGKFHDGYHEYPNLAIQIFGGSKPQNISQLNSERHGENWLLPSYPPTWRSERIRPPLRTATVFHRRWFGARSNVRELEKALADFLAKTRDYTNINIRRAREDIVDSLVDELFQFAAELAELPSGWSADAECHLVEAEALWLDPERANDDEAFAALYAHGGWKDEVASRFGNWLNAQLRSRKSLPLGDAESSEWNNVVEKRLANIKMEIGHE